MSKTPDETRRGCNPVGCLGRLLAYGIVFFGGFVAGVSLEVMSDHEFGGSTTVAERETTNETIEDDAESNPKPERLKRPSGTYLYRPGLDALMVCDTEADAKRLSQLIAAEDHLGYLGMIHDGRAWREKAGTKITVIDVKSLGGPSEVRLLEGENAGRAVWIPNEYIHQQ